MIYQFLEKKCVFSVKEWLPWIVFWKPSRGEWTCCFLPHSRALLALGCVATHRHRREHWGYIKMLLCPAMTTPLCDKGNGDECCFVWQHASILQKWRWRLLYVTVCIHSPEMEMKAPLCDSMHPSIRNGDECSKDDARLPMWQGNKKWSCPQPSHPTECIFHVQLHVLGDLQSIQLGQATTTTQLNQY